mgnify:CR=1 FL=1
MKPMLKVLIVDDSSLIRKIITSALHKHPDMKVIATAENGEDAIAAVQKHLIEIDVVILDIEMPVMDGIDAISILRADPTFASLPILALTSRAMVGDRERCIAAGANDYLTKPVQLKQLTHAILSHFNHLKIK